MSTSPTSKLSKPVSGERVPATTLAYFGARAQRFAFEVVVKELERSGITQSELGKRLGMDAGQISRLLGAPSNWTIKTHSSLLFAISGAVPTFGIDYPLDKPQRNYAGTSAALAYQKQSEVTQRPEAGRLVNVPVYETALDAAVWEKAKQGQGRADEPR